MEIFTPRSPGSPQLSALEVPLAWRKVDVLREARATQLHFFDNLNQRQLMEDVFFLKRLQTIRDFFRLCASFAQTLSGTTDTQKLTLSRSFVAFLPSLHDKNMEKKMSKIYIDMQINRTKTCPWCVKV